MAAGVALTIREKLQFSDKRRRLGWAVNGIDCQKIVSDLLAIGKTTW
jgi:hypothetical protein